MGYGTCVQDLAGRSLHTGFQTPPSGETISVEPLASLNRPLRGARGLSDWAYAICVEVWSGAARTAQRLE